jgi:hypothetical protein
MEGVDLSRPEDVKAHLFGTVLEMQKIDASSDTREPLALELREFVEAVRGGRKPRVSGDEALAAMRVADLVLEGIRTHPWNGSQASVNAKGRGIPQGIPAPHIMRPRPSDRLSGRSPTGPSRSRSN